MERRLLQLLAMFIGFLCMETNGYNLSNVAVKVGCVQSERDALLKFKEGFNNPSDLFSSWLTKQDCCKWKGVGCNNMTGHIISLDLHSPDPSNFLQGELSESLLDLPYLSYLDLSLIDFRKVCIPNFIGFFHHLEYLNLSNTNFRGSIPDHLGNLSHLVSLDLSGNHYAVTANNLDWLSGLSSLQTLNLGGVVLTNAIDWLDVINMLPFLKELRLYACQLPKLPESMIHVNFTSLEILDLSLNNLNSRIPDWLFEIGHSLVYLNLSRNQFHGSVPHSFGNMSSLIVLDLSDNNLEGEIPTTLALIKEINQPREHSSLRELYLSRNQLNGSLEKSLAQLSKLVVLDVAQNFLEGVLTDAHLLNFTSLRVLDLSSNLLVVNASSSWIPAFQLVTIGLRSCQLGPQFPKWLRSQKNFSSIDLSDNIISDNVPNWFWNLSPVIEYMNLSYNGLKGELPDLSFKLHLSILDLSCNDLSGPLPHFSTKLRKLILAKNLFSGPMSCLCEILQANNSLSYLDLSSNRLLGELPDCWTYGQNLIILNLANNDLSGKIPESIGFLVHLNTLRLANNNLFGEIPESLKNCMSLFLFDLGRNKLSRSIPAGIGEISNLMILILRVNAFDGFIPVQLCQLKCLKILDLSFNQISGTIPRCVNMLIAMAEWKTVRSYINFPYTTYGEYLEATFKEYTTGSSRARFMFNGIDLSSNNLSGEIPWEITSLAELVILNLSSNYLTGAIPISIGAMENLEALDLSWNQLSCTIPTNMSHLLFLEVLNLKYNKLSGEIPTGYQFSTFEASSYLNNRNLCGSPLPKNCSGDESYEDPGCSKEAEDRYDSIIEGRHGLKIPSFYISVGLGFITGFWGFWGTLVFNSSWRYAYFRFLSNLNDKIYVIVAVNVARLQRKFRRELIPE